MAKVLERPAWWSLGPSSGRLSRLHGVRPPAPLLLAGLVLPLPCACLSMLGLQGNREEQEHVVDLLWGGACCRRAPYIAEERGQKDHTLIVWQRCAALHSGSVLLAVRTPPFQSNEAANRRRSLDCHPHHTTHRPLGSRYSVHSIEGKSFGQTRLVCGVGVFRPPIRSTRTIHRSTNSPITSECNR